MFSGFKVVMLLDDRKSGNLLLDESGRLSLRPYSALILVFLTLTGVGDSYCIFANLDIVWLDSTCS